MMKLVDMNDLDPFDLKYLIRSSRIYLNCYVFPIYLRIIRGECAAYDRNVCIISNAYFFSSNVIWRKAIGKY